MAIRQFDRTKQIRMSYNVVGIGEVLWDLLPDGPQLGGAPANFAYHARALGANAAVVSRVGNDQLGRQIFERFTQIGLPLKTLQVDSDAPTGTAGVTINQSGNPHFDLQTNVAWDRLASTAELLDAAQQAHAICFGTLAQRSAVSRETIQRFLATAPTEVIRIFDVNLREGFYSRDVIDRSLGLANALKLNNEELMILADMFSITGTLRDQIRWLAERYCLRFVALTSGESGSLLYNEGRWSERCCKATLVADTVGAGDSFTAALVMGLLAKMTLSDTHAFASDVAGFVCSQSGATPTLPQSFRNRCQPLNVELASEHSNLSSIRP